MTSIDGPGDRVVTPFRRISRNVLGFYTYTLGAEIFSCVSVAVFLPVALEQIARRNGYLDYDYTRPCVVDGQEAGEGFETCMVNIFGFWTLPASFSLAVKSISVAIQALTVISISVLADHPAWRKTLLVVFGRAGAICTMGLSILGAAFPSSLLPLAILAIISVVGFGSSFVCLNAFLPDAAKFDNEDFVLQDLARDNPRSHDFDTAETAAFLNRDPQDDPEDFAALQLDTNAELIRSRLGPMGSSNYLFHGPSHTAATTKISSIGIAIGYAGGTAMLAILMVPVSLMGGNIGASMVAIGTTGCCWLAFTSLAAKWLPGPDRTKGVNPGPINVKKTIFEGWHRIWLMFTGDEVMRHQSIYWYLLAWAFMADAFGTITSVAILFAKTTLRMSSAQVALVGLLTQGTAVVSAFFTPALQRRTGFTEMRILQGCVLGALVMCVYALLGLLTTLGGLRTEGEMFALAIYFGLIFGPFSALSRSVFAELIPQGDEAQFFSLFSIVDKGASFVGPAAIAVIADKSGEIRYGFLFILGLLLVPLPILEFRVFNADGHG